MKEVMKKYIKKSNALPTIRYKRSGNAETQPRLPLATKFPNGKTNKKKKAKHSSPQYG
jgi:hypothetical protein